MAWQDKLQRGKFRDVEFFTVSAESFVGRRDVEHQYPLRDKPYVEDMGRQIRSYVIDGFVIGDDYMDHRDLLVKAFEAKGTGTFIHPYWGAQNVNLKDCRFKEIDTEGRIARFSATFLEAGENTTPGEDLDTASIVNERVNSGMLANIDDFSSVFSVSKRPAFVSTDAVRMVIDAMDYVEEGQVLTEVQTIRDNVETAVTNPRQLATDMSEVIRLATGDLSLKNMHGYGDDYPLIATTTPSRIVQANNQKAMISLVRNAAVMETARLLV